jgi:cytosine/adenosine deaminase-related metal-dependent hydrolase
MALVLAGTLVPVADHLPDQFAGRVYIGDDGRIDAVRKAGARAPSGFRDAPVVETDAAIYPGLIDLHSHTAYNTLPLWTEPGRVDPWAHHNSWTGAGSYHEKVVWPTGVLGYAAGPALLAYIGLKALVGGTTAIQGSVSKPKLRFPWVVRIVENEEVGDLDDPVRAATLTTTNPTKLKGYVDDMGEGKGFIYHCAEGRQGTVVTKEFDAVAAALGLRSELIAVHCTALTRADFDRWAPNAGTVVWSPFSNLWLYGVTTDVVAADRAGIRIALGSDWSPSGTKHLLGELKVADLHNRQSLDRWFSDRRLVEMATANPGAALAGPWRTEVGRLVQGALADVVVVSRRHERNPYRNLIEATERDVRLVVIGGRACYGTAGLMTAAGATPMGAVRVAGESRRVSIGRPAPSPPRPGDPAEQWSVAEIRRTLDEVRRNPARSVASARGAIDAWAAAAAGGRADGRADGGGGGDLAPAPPLVVVPDVPGDETMVGGLPPDPSTTVIPPLDSLVHDDAFFRSVSRNPIHLGQLDGLAAYYGSGA